MAKGKVFVEGIHIAKLEFGRTMTAEIVPLVDWEDEDSFKGYDRFTGELFKAFRSGLPVTIEIKEDND